MELELELERQQGAHEAGGAPPPSWTGGGPRDVDSSSSIFIIFQKYVPWSFRSFRELLFLHINNTMAILLKIASVWLVPFKSCKLESKTRAKAFGKVDTTETYQSTRVCTISDW